MIDDLSMAAWRLDHAAVHDAEVVRLVQINPADDADILNVTATIPICGTTQPYEYRRVLQDRRIYYSLTRNGNRTGILTTAKGARETIAYWKTKGWTA